MRCYIRMFTIFLLNYADSIRFRMAKVIKNKLSQVSFDYSLCKKDGHVIELEVSSSCLTYGGKAAIQSVIRNISELKKNLNSAASIQATKLAKRFPLEDKCSMDSLYFPAKTASGDFYCFHKVNENLVVGALCDVCGKGISAALNTSAFHVLFLNEVNYTLNPLEIVESLNKKIHNHMEGTYIAACCFCLDFENQKLHVVGAGISQFVHKYANKDFGVKTVKGAFLGMFENSEFEEIVVDFSWGDTIYFYSDGLELVFDDYRNIRCKIKEMEAKELLDHVADILKDKQLEAGGIRDDCTVIALNIKKGD